MATVLHSSAQGPAPTFVHASEGFLAAHTRARAWSPGTVIKYRQTLTGPAAGLASGPVERSVSALDTPAGAAALETAFTVAYGALAPATRALMTLAESGSGALCEIGQSRPRCDDDRLVQAESVPVTSVRGSRSPRSSAAASPKVVRTPRPGSGRARP